MSPDFITQVVNDQPQVLIVSSSPNLSRICQQAMQTWHLAEVLTQPAALTPEQLAAAYKIVWIVSGPESDPLAFASILKPQQAKLNIITAAISPIAQENPLAKSWWQQSQREKTFLQQIQTTFAHASLIVGQDVLPERVDTFPLFQLMAQAVTHQKVIDPQISVYLQTWTQFMEIAAKLVIIPHQDVYVVQGKKITSSAVAKLFQLHLQRFTQLLLDIENLPLELANLPLPDIVPQLTKETLELDSVVRQVAQTIASSYESQQSIVVSPTPTLPLPTSDKTKISQAAQLHAKLNKSSWQEAASTKHAQKPATSGGVTKIPRHIIPVITPTFAQTVAQASLGTTSVATPPARSRLAKKQKEPAPQQVIEDEVMRLFQDNRIVEKNEHVKTVAKTTVKTTKKLVHKKKAFIGGVIFVVLGLAVSVLIGFLFLSSWQVKRHLIASLTNTNTYQPSSSARWWSTITTWQVNAYTRLFDHTHFASTLTAAELMASLPIIESHIDELNKMSEIAVLQALGRKDGDVIATISDINSQAQSLYELLSQNQAKLKELPTDDISESQQKSLDQYQANLIQTKKNLLPAQQLQPLMASILGHTTKRTYAVVLQNNQELRPTGGFVQAVALVTIDQGMLIDSQVFNVYDLDGQTVGVVQPPAEITQLLGEKQWFLRDSNWNPDFPTSAKQMAVFIERATGRKVDGVLALNLFVAEDILKAIGPVDLPEYNEVITDRNIHERMEFHSEIQLVPSATQPDYSTLFLNRLLQKITQVQADKVPALLSVIQTNFDQKQLLLSFIDQNELASVTALGWSGALLSPTCPIQLGDVACTVDTVAQVEANVGINKANVYLDRTVSHQIEVSPTQAHHVRQMVFTNKATSNAWPKGTYKTFIRLYVPQTAELTKVMVDGSPLPPTQTVVKTEQDRRVFGFVVDVPIQKSVTVSVDYSVPLSTTSTPFSYAFFNQQQSGIESGSPTITIKPVDGLKPNLIAPQATLQGQAVVFDPVSNGHSFVGIKF